jgi:hypothetical protein
MAWYDNQKYIVNGPKGTDVGLNVMTLYRDISKMDLDSIVKEAIEYTKREGEPVGSKRVMNVVRMSDVWRKTDLKRGKHKEGGRGIRGTFRLKSAPVKSARASPSYGITQSFLNVSCPAAVIKQAVHEAVHIIQLGQYTSPHINGKRRPHSLLYNRIFLKLMQKVVGLKEEQCNPYKMGYNVGNGYAPTRKIYTVLKEKIEKRDTKVMSLFKDKAVVRTPKAARPTTQATLAKRSLDAHWRQLKAILQHTQCEGGDDRFEDYLAERDFATACWRTESERIINSIIEHKSPTHISVEDDNFLAMAWDSVMDDDYNWGVNGISESRYTALCEAYQYFFHDFNKDYNKRLRALAGGSHATMASTPKQEAIFASPALDPWDSLNVRGLVRLLRSHGVAVTGGKREDLIERAKSMGITPRGGA